MEEIAKAAEMLNAADVPTTDRVVYNCETGHFIEIKGDIMKERIINVLIKILLDYLTPDLVEKALNSALDVIEEAVKDTENDYDDRILMPVIKTIREIID